MEARVVGVFIAIFIAIFFSMFAAFDSENRRSVAWDKRLAEHRMNARLLRLDI
jgi:hypothetical protein